MAKLAGLLKEQTNEWIDEEGAGSSMFDDEQDTENMCRQCGHSSCAGWCKRGTCTRCPECEERDEEPGRCCDCEKPIPDGELFCLDCEQKRESEIKNKPGMDEGKELSRKDSGIWGQPASVEFENEHEDEEYCLDCGEKMIDGICPRERKHSENYGMNEGWGPWVSRQGPLDDREGKDNDPGGFFDEFAEEEEKDISVYDALNSPDKEIGENERLETDNMDMGMDEQLSPKEYLAGHDESPIDPPDWERDAWGKIIDPDYPDDADKEYRQRGWEEQEAYHKAIEEKDEDLFQDDSSFGGNPFRGSKSSIKFESALKIVIRNIIKEVAASKEKKSKYSLVATNAKMKKMIKNGKLPRKSRPDGSVAIANVKKDKK